MTRRRGIRFAAYGGRKFVMAFWGLNAAFILALVGKLTGEFTTIASICVGAFAIGDTVISHKAIDKGVAKEYGHAATAGDGASGQEPDA